MNRSEFSANLDMQRPQAGATWLQPGRGHRALRGRRLTCATFLVAIVSALLLCACGGGESDCQDFNGPVTPDSPIGQCRAAQGANHG